MTITLTTLRNRLRTQLMNAAGMPDPLPVAASSETLTTLTDRIGRFCAAPRTHTSVERAVDAPSADRGRFPPGSTRQPSGRAASAGQAAAQAVSGRNTR